MSERGPMRDYEIAKQFFDMLKSKGFGIKEEDYNGKQEFENHWSEDGRSFCILNDDGQSIMEFDFVHGDFYRVSGFTSGYWQDEVDYKKY